MERPVRTNIVVRALIFHHDHLLLVRWREPVTPPIEYFPVGGRVEFGESILEALHREILEETGCRVTAQQFLYTHENFVRMPDPDFREYNWFFRVELDHLPMAIGETRPNPDLETLELAYLPVGALAEHRGLYPEILRRLVPSDVAEGFTAPPRHVVSHLGEEGQRRVHELYAGSLDGGPALARWES